MDDYKRVVKEEKPLMAVLWVQPPKKPALRGSAGRVGTEFSFFRTGLISGNASQSTLHLVKVTIAQRKGL